VEVRHTCPSCGKELVLKTHPRGLFAFCGACGLHEWLWSPEDDYEALVENAERMGIPLWKVQAAVEGLAFPGPPRRGGVELGLASERISGRPDPLALGEAVFSLPTVFLNGRRPDLEEKAERVIGHEAVHITISRLFRGAPLEYLERIHGFWDLASVDLELLSRNKRNHKTFMTENRR